MRATRKDGLEGHELIEKGFRFKRLVVRKCVKGFVFKRSFPRRKLGKLAVGKDLKTLSSYRKFITPVFQSINSST